MKASKFFLSTFIAAAAMTSTAWADDLTIAKGETHSVNNAMETWDTVIVDEEGTFTVSGESSLNIGTLTGTVKAADGAVIKDSTIGGSGTVFANGNLTFQGANTIGTLNPGWYNHTITIGESASVATTTTGRTTLSYGNIIDVDGTIANAKTADKSALTASLNIKGGMSLANSGAGATLNVDNAYVSFGSTTSKNSSAPGVFNMNFTNSVVDFTNNFVTNVPTKTGLDPKFNITFTGSVASTASHMELWNTGTILTLNNSDLTIGGAFANAGIVNINNGSVLTVKNPIMSSHGGNTGAIIVDDATLTLEHAGENFVSSGVIDAKNGGSVSIARLTNNGVIYLDNSSFTSTGYLGGSGSQLFVTGTSTLAGGDYTGDTKLRIGQVDADKDGKADKNDDEEVVTENNNITLSSGSYSFAFGNAYNANITLAQDTTIKLTGLNSNSYFFMRNTDLNLGGRTLTLEGGLLANVDISNGTLIFEGDKGGDGSAWSHLCFKDNDALDGNQLNVIAKDAIVDVRSASLVSIYEDTTIYGKLHDNSDVAYLNVGQTVTQNVINGGDYQSNGANLLISGDGAEFVSKNNGMIVHNVTEFHKEYDSTAAASSVTVENGAKLELGGTLTNNSLITITTDAALIAGAIVNNGNLIVDSSTAEVGDLTNSGTLKIINATVTVTGTFTNTGSLVIQSGGKLIDGAGDTIGMSLTNASVTVEDESGKSVALSATAEGVVVNSATNITNDVSIGGAVGDVAAAWSFDVSNKAGAEVSVEMEVGQLNLDTIQIWHSENGETWNEVTESVNYNYVDGKVIFTVNSFSSYAVTGSAVPEPSAFGLLAGLGALALVAARRRRSR